MKTATRKCIHCEDKILKSDQCTIISCNEAENCVIFSETGWNQCLSDWWKIDGGKIFRPQLCESEGKMERGTTRVGSGPRILVSPKNSYTRSLVRALFMWCMRPLSRHPQVIVLLFFFDPHVCNQVTATTALARFSRGGYVSVHSEKMWKFKIGVMKWW